MLAQTSRLEEFEKAALPHLHDLYRTAARVLRNASDAQDVVQETYLQAWKSFHRFEPGTNCKAWLFGILFHVTGHHRRKTYRTKPVSDGDQLLERVLVYEPPIPEEITDEDILAALARVPQRFREVILLVDVQEFSYRETSKMLRIPIGTVMSRLSRGRECLRTCLVAAGIAGFSPRKNAEKPCAAVL